MHSGKSFAQCASKSGSRSELKQEALEQAKHRINTGDFASAVRGLHRFCGTGLWTGCTALMNKKLMVHEFD